MHRSGARGCLSRGSNRDTPLSALLDQRPIPPSATDATPQPARYTRTSSRMAAAPTGAGGLPTLTALDEELDRMIAALDAEALEKCVCCCGVFLRG